MIKWNEVVESHDPMRSEWKNDLQDKVNNYDWKTKFLYHSLGWYKVKSVEHLMSVELIIQ